LDPRVPLAAGSGKQAHARCVQDRPPFRTRLLLHEPHDTCAMFRPCKLERGLVQCRADAIWIDGVELHPDPMMSRWKPRVYVGAIIAIEKALKSREARVAGAATCSISKELNRKL
jgi:hypothetical protein